MILPLDKEQGLYGEADLVLFKPVLTILLSALTLIKYLESPEH